MVVEVPGAEGATKADALSARLRSCFAERDGVKIARSVRKAELRLRGLDRSIRTDELAAAIAAIGGCKAEGGHGPHHPGRMVADRRGVAGQAPPPMLRMLGEGTCPATLQQPRG